LQRTTRFYERGIDIFICLEPDGKGVVASVALAAWHGRVDVIKLLHEVGADINAHEKVGGILQQT
jgi:hypothetical protein